MSHLRSQEESTSSSGPKNIILGLDFQLDTILDSSQWYLRINDSLVIAAFKTLPISQRLTITSVIVIAWAAVLGVFCYFLSCMIPKRFAEGLQCSQVCFILEVT